MKTEWNEGYEKGYADALGMLNLKDDEIEEIWLSLKVVLKTLLEQY